MCLWERGGRPPAEPVEPGGLGTALPRADPPPDTSGVPASEAALCAGGALRQLLCGRLLMTWTLFFNEKRFSLFLNKVFTFSPIKTIL